MIGEWVLIEVGKKKWMVVLKRGFGGEWVFIEKGKKRWMGVLMRGKFLVEPSNIMR